MCAVQSDAFFIFIMFIVYFAHFRDFPSFLVKRVVFWALQKSGNFVFRSPFVWQRPYFREEKEKKRIKSCK